MEKYLKELPPDYQELLHIIGNLASLRGMSVYLVGGIVRDLMLGVKNFDLDIVVEGDGILLAEDLAGKFNARLIRHKRFRTATVILGHHLKVDVATARKETYEMPAALPEVAFSNLGNDLKRRDFTINAMAININKNHFGMLLDPFGGKCDLSAKKIRILHDISFVDDPTRILRAIRFEKRCNFAIEKETFFRLKEAVKDKMLERVQPQRTRDELILLFKEMRPLKYIKRLKELTGFEFIHPNIKVAGKSLELLENTQKQIEWFLNAHSRHRKLDVWLMYFMALIDSLSLQETKNVCSKFVFKKGEEKRIIDFKKINDSFIAKLGSKKIEASDIFRILSPLSFEVLLLIKAKHKGALVKSHIEDFLEIYSDIRICVSGSHLQELGIEPGPVYQKIFALVLDAKINGLVKTEQQELFFIKELLRENKISLTRIVH